MSDRLDQIQKAFDSSVWVIRDENDRPITSLEPPALEPGETYTKELSFEYRGARPIKVLGFYLTALERPFYIGDRSPGHDLDEVLSWAENFESSSSDSGYCGVSVSYIDYDTGDTVEHRLRSTSGGSLISPVPYTGTENSILDLNQRIRIQLIITAPLDSKRELVNAFVGSFALDISFIEIPENIEGQLVFSGA